MSRSASQQRRRSIKRSLLENFQKASAEYKLLLKEQNSLNEQKTVLQDVIDQLHKEIKAKYNQALKLKSNKEHLQGQFKDLDVSKKRIEKNRNLTKKELAHDQQDIGWIDSDIKFLVKSKESLEKSVSENQETVKRLQNVIVRMKKEIQLQTKDRDCARNQYKDTLKQVRFTESKISNMIEKMKTKLKILNIHK